jgi:hypothetical protein
MPTGHFDLHKVNSLLADQPLSTKAEQFKMLFESFQTKPSAGDASMPLLAGLGSLLASGNKAAGPPSFAALMASSQLMATQQMVHPQMVATQQMAHPQLMATQLNNSQLKANPQMDNLQMATNPLMISPQLMTNLRQIASPQLMAFEKQQLPADPQLQELSSSVRKLTPNSTCADTAEKNQSTSLEDSMPDGGDTGTGTEQTAVEVNERGDSSLMSAVAPHVPVDAAMRDYIDTKFQELELRLLQRMQTLEQNFMNKLDLLTSRLAASDADKPVS